MQVVLESKRIGVATSGVRKRQLRGRRSGEDKGPDSCQNAASKICCGLLNSEIRVCSIVRLAIMVSHWFGMRKSSLYSTLIACFAVGVWVVYQAGADDALDFNREIRPILSE